MAGRKQDTPFVARKEEMRKKQEIIKPQSRTPQKRVSSSPC